MDDGRDCEKPEGPDRKRPVARAVGLEGKYAPDAKIVTKLGYFNPAGSVRDRIGYAMIQNAEDRGLLHRDSVLIEPTTAIRA